MKNEKEQLEVLKIRLLAIQEKLGKKAVGKGVTDEKQVQRVP